MMNYLTLIGAPGSAGAYSPGQEKAPAALRDAGLPDLLSSKGVPVKDMGDTTGFRWKPDKKNPRAMNTAAAIKIARETAERVRKALADDSAAVVLGGDCTVELGTVAGSLHGNKRVGLVYIDVDTDLNTPQSTDDGALDWMGVAHMLGIDGTVPGLVDLGPRTPMLEPDQILFFALENVKPFERKIIDQHSIAEVPLQEVAADPSSAAQKVVNKWAPEFDRLLIHLDMDVLDFADMPLAENTRRNMGLKFHQLMEALEILLRSPNFAALTITELNPDHGNSDGSTLRFFAEALADVLAQSWHK